MRIIRGKFGKRRFEVPKNITARPTTDFARENIFNIIENLIDLEDKHALDLFAGTGAVSWELVSRGCSEVVCVEKAPVQVDFIKKVKDKLSDTTLKLIKGDVFKFIERCDRNFDLVFADPPYDHPLFSEIPELILNSKLVGNGSLVIIEHNKSHDFSGFKEFKRHLCYGSVNFSIFQVGTIE